MPVSYGGEKKFISSSIRCEQILFFLETYLKKYISKFPKIMENQKTREYVGYESCYRLQETGTKKFGDTLIKKIIQSHADNLIFVYKNGNTMITALI